VNSFCSWANLFELDILCRDVFSFACLTYIESDGTWTALVIGLLQTFYSLLGSILAKNSREALFSNCQSIEDGALSYWICPVLNFSFCKFGGSSCPGFIQGLTLDRITWFSKGELSGFKFVPTEWLGNLVKVLDNLCMAVRYTWLGTHNVRRLQCCSCWIDARLYVFHLYCIWSKNDVICWTCVANTCKILSDETTIYSCTYCFSKISSLFNFDFSDCTKSHCAYNVV
jgi:hypothetical protein